jgi:hypothetical protein
MCTSTTRGQYNKFHTNYIRYQPQHCLKALEAKMSHQIFASANVYQEYLSMGKGKINYWPPQTGSLDTADALLVFEHPKTHNQDAALAQTLKLSILQ